MILNIILPSPLNQSVQTGDIAYYLKLANSQIGGFTTHNSTDNIVKIGRIRLISYVDTDADQVVDSVMLICDADDNLVQPDPGDFILFSKDRMINEASPIGYYGSFKFVNSSRSTAELFSATAQVSENSK